MSACPITIENLKVCTLSVDHNEVSWSVRVATIDVLDYTFQVLRSESPEGPWDELSPAFEDGYIYLDNAVMSHHRYRQWYYRIRVRRKGTQEFWDSAPATQEQEVDLVGGEVRSHLTMLHREFIGVRCWVLPVRTFGPRCTSCYSVTARNKTRSGCRTCWDTSFVRGYMHPIETWVSIDPSPDVEQSTEAGKLQQTDTTARMPYFPPMKPGDVIVESAAVRRWRVNQVSKPRHVGTATHQELGIHEIPQSNIEYGIEIKLCEELRNMFMQPERNTTNPQHMDSLGKEATDGIFNLFNVGKDRTCR
jgi:hypothetical protein